MRKAEIIIDKYFQIGEIDKRLFGSFIEHLGRAVYEGIYQPDSPFADAKGYRKDTMDLVKELQVPIIRYPGGNFASSYKWEDSVGPRTGRKKKVDLAWHVVETNEFGLNEFSEWAGKVNSEIMMAVNLGTRGITEAVELLEYCNMDKGTYFSELRKQHGILEPYNIKTWCLGNEMDGDWQIGHKTAKEYGRLANETGKAMKALDPSIELVACGSSNSQMATFGEWEATVLDYCYDTVDYISMHQYYSNADSDSVSFLASNVDLEQFIQRVVATCDYVKGKKRRKKEMYISLDEWNVWYHSLEQDKQLEKWTQAPHQLEDVYNFEDALLVGSMLITMMRHADRIKIGCMAQLVNVIAPIMTSETGAWRQTIFYPYYYAIKYGKGKVLNTLVKAPLLFTKKYGEVPSLDAVFVDNEELDELVLFSVNKDLEDDVEVSVDLRQYEEYHFAEQIRLHHENLKAINTEDNPLEVAPEQVNIARLENGKLTVWLKRQSFNIIRLGRVKEHEVL